MRVGAKVSCNVAVLVFAMLVPATLASQPSVEDGELPFRLFDLDGQVVSSSDSRFAGKVVLVTLWATWCPPCLTEIPTLIELQEEFRERGLIIVAIAFEAEETEVRRERLREFSRERAINYLVLDGGMPEDFESALPSVKNVRGFPVEILLDRSGRVAEVRNSSGFKKSWVKRLQRDLESLLDASGEP